MILLNPHSLTRYYPDERSRQIMASTIGFFERKGKRQIKEDDRNRSWYADFLEFQKQERLFATLLTPGAYGFDPDCRWDTWRNCEFNEILGFYGLAYWYTWQVSILGLGPADYLRSASPDDRRYLLYNPLVKMKVTTQGEEVINLLWDVIAAKGFEKDTFFEMAARDIRALPKLEGTVHVNIALIVKFMPNYFFFPAEYPDVRRRDDPQDDTFLWSQGPARGLGQIRFHDFRQAFQERAEPNVKLFLEQALVLQELLATATPDDAQQKDVDYLLALGELFALVVYGQLVLENAGIYKDEIDVDLVDQIFDCLVRDFSMHALRLYSKPSSTPRQMALCQRMLRRPAVDPGRFSRVWEQVQRLKDAYELAE
jgi:acyl-CoA dehydrogenase